MPYNPKSLKNLVNVNGPRRLKGRFKIAKVGEDQLQTVKKAITDVVASMAKPIRDLIFEGYFEAIKSHVEVTLEANNEASGYPHELDPIKQHTLLDSIDYESQGDTVSITYGDGLVEAKYAAMYNAPRGTWFEIYPTHGKFLKFPNRKDLPDYDEYVYARSVSKEGQGIFDEAVTAADAILPEIMDQAIEEYRNSYSDEDTGVSRKGSVYRRKR